MTEHSARYMAWVSRVCTMLPGLMAPHFATAPSDLNDTSLTHVELIPLDPLATPGRAGHGSATYLIPKNPFHSVVCWPSPPSCSKLLRFKTYSVNISTNSENRHPTVMSAPPPGFGGRSAAPPGFQPNGDSGMEGDFFGTLTPEEIEKKARKWRSSQKKRYNEKRRRGGGGGIDMGKAVSVTRRAYVLLLLDAQRPQTFDAS